MMLRATALCRVCSNGDLVFSVRSDTGGALVECLECVTAYLDPSAAPGGPILNLTEVDWSTRPASIADLRRLGLTELVDWPPG
jgi:hypothetical protein